LKLELTETLVIDDMEDSIAKMSELRSAGVRFSMDDFGTGQSSLSYLTRLPLSQLKIDQSFVRHLGERHTDDVVAQTIIGMAHNLGLTVIAEGVELQSQFDSLVRFGCQRFQGYFFSRPRWPTWSALWSRCRPGSPPCWATAQRWGWAGTWKLQRREETTMPPTIRRKATPW
jgi:EAL domain-containing protein (putative c-di-GMP-specific phosphodiesterase class I)